VNKVFTRALSFTRWHHGSVRGLISYMLGAA
jgi:hypothetical protein